MSEGHSREFQRLDCIASLCQANAAFISCERQNDQQSGLFEKTPAQPFFFCAAGTVSAEDRAGRRFSCNIIPGIRFLSYLFPRSYTEYQGRGICCNTALPPRCQVQEEDHSTFPVGIWPLHLSPCIASVLDYFSTPD